MKVYTVSSRDDPPRFEEYLCVVGSYTSRGEALDACVDYILEQLAIRDDLARCMANDRNHPEAAEFFSERRKDGVTAVRRGCSERLREFLRGTLGGQGCYYVCDGESNWRFDVDENDVEGELWHTVTWGDSDTEDPEFTTPWPEAFTSEGTAIKTFVDYAKDRMASRGMDVPDNFYAVVKQQLGEDGKCQVDLNDGCSVSCVLYHDDTKNIKE